MNGESVSITLDQAWITSTGLVTLASALILIVLVCARLLVHRYGVPGREVLIAEYAPPEGINVMVAAHLVGRSRAAVPAQLLELAVNGNIRVLDRSQPRERSAYAVEYRTNDNTDELGGLFLRAIFGSDPVRGAVRELQARNPALRSNVATVSAVAFGVARDRGWRGRASWSQWLVLAASSALLVYTLLAGALAAIASVFSVLYVFAFFAAIAAFLLSLFSIRLFGPLTASGAMVRDQLRGIRIYLELAEEDRLRMLQGAQTSERITGAGSAVVVRVYERLLPYAVVWHVERTWIRQLIGDSIDLSAAPEWLADVNALSFTEVSRRLNNRMDAFVQSALRKAVIPPGS